MNDAFDKVEMDGGNDCENECEENRDIENNDGCDQYDGWHCCVSDDL